MDEVENIIEAVNFTTEKSAYNYQAGVVVNGIETTVTHGYCNIASSQMEGETSVITHNPQGQEIKDYTHNFLDGKTVYLQIPRPDPSGEGMIKEWVSFESPGISTSQIWMLFWLYATVDAKEIQPNKYQITIDPQVLGKQAPADKAQELVSGLRQSALGQIPGIFHAVVTLSDEGVIDSMNLVINDYKSPEHAQTGAVAEAAEVIYVLHLTPTPLQQLKFPEVNKGN
ncbi:MAG: hypothetical protein QM632_01915 [Micrococcaceae bacterium]